MPVENNDNEDPSGVFVNECSPTPYGIGQVLLDQNGYTAFGVPTAVQEILTYVGGEARTSGVIGYAFDSSANSVYSIQELAFDEALNKLHRQINLGTSNLPTSVQALFHELAFAPGRVLRGYEFFGRIFQFLLGNDIYHQDSHEVSKCTRAASVLATVAYTYARKWFCDYYCVRFEQHPAVPECHDSI
jgi:hypothetical protein